jgi:hypothetical protein
MRFNSMTPFRENLPRLRQQYAALRTKKARTRFLERLTAALGINRKYLIKLLRGKRRYKPHRGRGPTYTPSARRLLAVPWRAAGRPCAEYLKPMLPKLAADLAALGHALPPADLEAVLKMSASTLGRSLRALPDPRPARRNKHAGKNALKQHIPEIPGSQLPEDKPGTCQIDTVALCGGNMAESFFHIASLTDAATQWFECAPAWNHSAPATTRAMTRIHARLPFAIAHLHPDNGTEFINALFIQAMEKLSPGVRFSRSRPYKKNDNCRVEQKNGSVLRAYFGDLRFDCHDHYPALDKLCADIALYTNLFRPCKKLISKERKSCKGVVYTKRYDAPRTPLERLSDFLPVDAPQLLSYRRQHATLNSVTLLKSIHRQLRVLVRELSVPLSGCGSPPPEMGTRARLSAPGVPSLSVSTHLTDATTT